MISLAHRTQNNRSSSHRSGHAYKFLMLVIISVIHSEIDYLPKLYSQSFHAWLLSTFSQSKCLV